MRRCALLCLLLLPAVAFAQNSGDVLLAHGEAAWIMHEPRYVDATNRHCCGPVDCAPLADGEMLETKDGIRDTVTGDLLKWGEKGIYRSRDARWWGCRSPGFDGKLRTRCAFPPGGDS